MPQQIENGQDTETSSDEKPEEEKSRAQQEREHEEVLDKAAASAHIVYRAILKESEEELSRPSIALAWSGLAAGLSMGFTLILEGLIRSHLPDAPWRDLIAKLGYTVGFVILILSRQQLFTENTLTPILSLLKRRDSRTALSVARLWGVILVSNLIGGVLIAYTLERSHVFTADEKKAFLEIASESMQPPKLVLFTKAIFAGWLIALMVWMLPVAETGRIAVLVIIPYIVGLGALSHIIIGSIYSFYTIAAHQHTWAEYFLHFAWPVLLGNCLGGVTLVAAVNFAQATAGSPGRGSSAPDASD